MADFVPQLQTVLGAMNDVLQLCQTHANALPVLSEQLQRNVASEKEQRPILVYRITFAAFCGNVEDSNHTQRIYSDGKYVQSFRQCQRQSLQPLHAKLRLSCKTGLTTKQKQLGVRRWLAQMEAYPGVPPLRGHHLTEYFELHPGGCTLELDDMTVEVKDAFLLLVIPILKQNRALHVSVFTRYAGIYEATTKQSLGNEEVGIEKVWSMRIHVLSTVASSPLFSFSLYHQVLAIHRAFWHLHLLYRQ
ncbi:unnamed protein product [Peronospora belbahrii]|uniref:Uncharacterized protein n=1 Tax=Peronospora belbahrii TaxID=622444 RepID=A0ABN8CRK4_9STRA|nr:unnamed protein product [Peronospora belbahrii]